MSSERKQTSSHFSVPSSHLVCHPSHMVWCVVLAAFPSVQFVYHHYVQPWHWQASTLGQAAIVAYMVSEQTD